MADTQTWANTTTHELLDGIRQLLAGTGLTDTTQMTGAINYLSYVFVYFNCIVHFLIEFEKVLIFVNNDLLSYFNLFHNVVLILC